MEPWLIWLVIALVLVVIETITVGFFAIIIAMGALVAMLLSFLTPSIPIQATVFLLISVIMLVRIRPLLQRHFPLKEETHTAVDRLKGRKAIVVEEIDNVFGKGQIKCDGEVWSARSEDGEKVAVDTSVIIVKIEGVRAVVRSL